MLVIISPAKTLDFESTPLTPQYSQPDMLEDSHQLVDILRELSPHELSALMSISDKLGLLNYDRYQQWTSPFTAANARQALLAFKASNVAAGGNYAHPCAAQGTVNPYGGERNVNHAGEVTPARSQQLSRPRGARPPPSPSPRGGAASRTLAAGRGSASPARAARRPP